jgi:hypothetical protein
MRQHLLTIVLVIGTISLMALMVLPGDWDVASVQIVAADP